MAKIAGQYGIAVDTAQIRAVQAMTPAQQPMAQPMPMQPDMPPQGGF